MTEATVLVRVGERPCPVHIASGGLADAGRRIRDHLGARRVVLVADERVARLHGRALLRSLRGAGVRPILRIDLPAGERTKSLARAQALYRAMAEAGADRGTPVVALGGGVIGDLAAFAASTWMRGVPVVQIPTSVVAQVDSAVGGKTAVNFEGVKNLIGTFHQPSLVLIDPDLLATLSPRDFRAGLAEVVKIAVTLRPDLMELLERSADDLLARRSPALGPAIRAAVEAKAEVVGRDEKDRDVRAILNYGHTIGHALEGASRGRLRHGEAVAIGMRAAAWVGQTLDVTHPEAVTRQNLLLDRLGLKGAAHGVDKGVVARNLKLDKKVHDQSVRFVLTLQIGGASVWPHIPTILLRRAIRRVTD